MNILKILEGRTEADVAVLGTSGEYQKYFEAVLKMLKYFLLWIDKSGENKKVAEIFKPLIVRFANTINILSLRHTYDPLRTLSLDLNDSGFPTSFSFEMLASDLEKVSILDLESASRSHLLDRLAKVLLSGSEEEEKKILELLGRRSYVDALKEGEVFCTFTEGSLEEISSVPGKNKTFGFNFGTLCNIRNIPIFYHLIFEVSSEEGFDSNHPLFKELLKLLKYETGFESPLGAVVTNIDAKFPNIHPKMMQRVRLGPFWSLDAFHSESKSPFYDLLNSTIAKAGDFVLEILVESIYSFGTRAESSGLFGLQSRVREKFFIPNDNLKAFERSSSTVSSWLMLPSRLHRRIDWSTDELKKYSGHKKIAVNENTVHETD